jgi:peptidylprolyl isomerase
MSVVLKPPTASEHPRPQDKVRLEFAAWTPEGVVIDASQVRGGPVTFSSAEMLPGLASSVAEMAAGEKRRLWIPAELAFGGQRARPGVPLGQVTYDVELVSIERTPDAPSAPPDLTVIPADATRTASGLAYRILHEGEGKVHPITTDTVRVEYTGWTRDGKVFATTVGKGSNLLGVGSAMPGLTEGLQLMTEGEERLFWIPSALGHGEESTPERPAGMLVFDIKLVHIRRVPREN